MSEDPQNGVPDSVHRIIEAMVHQAVARCDREGIAREDFYRALVEEQKLRPKISPAELFERTFRRLEGMTN